jgi:hypothetical protein
MGVHELCNVTYDIYLAMTGFHLPAGGALMSIAPQHETYWYVTEMDHATADTRGRPRMHSFTVANSQPRMLRWVAAPHLETHRVVAARRQRAGSGPSCVRLVLESLKDPRHQIVLHALIITLTVIR